MSTASSIFCGVATGEALSLPSPTYLRTRFRSLQSRKVSQGQGRYRRAIQGKPFIDKATVSSDDMDPSSQGIEDQNRPQPEVMHSINKDLEIDNISSKTPSDPSTPPHRESQGQRLETAEHDPHSFIARVDRLIQAVDQGQHIRFTSPDRDGNVSVFARDANPLSEPWSEESVTAQITANPENFGRIVRPGDLDVQRSPSSQPHRHTSRSVNVMSLDYILSNRRESPSLETAPSRKESSHNTVESVRRLIVSPIISPEEQQALIQRIQDKILEYDQGVRKDAPTTVVHRGRREGADPRKVYTVQRSGTECHKISPIPLDYNRTRQPGTPSVRSSGSYSAGSSLLDHVATRQPKSEGHINSGENQGLAGEEVLERTSLQRLDDKVSPGRRLSLASEESEEDPVERQAKNRTIGSWLRRTGSVLKPSENSPARKLGKAFGVFQQKSATSVEQQQPTTPANRFEKALQDVTNIRKSGYLKWNSFAQDKLAKGKAKWGSSIRTPEDLAAHEMHPETAFTLARLEGRVAPRPLSPYQIRRSRDTDSYGSDVEVELASLPMHSTQPCRAVRVGEWTEAIQEAVDEGFDCGLNAPES